MHQLPVEQQILLVAQIVALAALCARFVRDGLHKIYVYFFGYLVVELLQLLVPVFVPLVGNMYRDTYVVSQALVIIFSALVVLELYSVVLHGLSRYVLPTRHGAQTRLCRCELPDLRDFGVMSPARWRHRFANLACAFFIETINRV